jgi:hypothetical protein
MAQRRSEVLQPLDVEEVGGERYHDAVGRNQHGPVDGTEVRAHVDEHHVGRDLPCGRAQQPPERRDHPEGTLLAVQALRPLAGELVLET